MHTRRSHKKSRTGCQQCKKKKVKCDEQVPCFNCVRTDTQCIYGMSPAQSQEDRCSSPATQVLDNTSRRPADPEDTHCPEFLRLNVITQGATRSRPYNAANRHCGPSGDVGRDHTVGLSTTPCTAEWTTDLDLMHHYCTSTAATMANREEMQNIWRDLFPKEGRQYPFVLNGILSLAALHKAYLLPDQKKTYLGSFARHQALGLETFIPLVSSLSQDLAKIHTKSSVFAWRPVFCFSTLMIANVCALPTRCPTGRLSNPLESTLELFEVVRGIQAIFGPLDQDIVNSDFGSLILGVYTYDGEHHSTTPGSQSEIQAAAGSVAPLDSFTALSNLRAWLIAELLQCPSLPTETAVGYGKALDSLQFCVRHLIRAGLQPEFGIMMMWPYLLPQVMMPELRAGSPFLQILVAYWAAFVAQVEERFWYGTGWGSALLDEIEENLQGSPYSSWLVWPRTCISVKLG